MSIKKRPSAAEKRAKVLEEELGNAIGLAQKYAARADELSERFKLVSEAGKQADEKVNQLEDDIRRIQEDRRYEMSVKLTEAAVDIGAAVRANAEAAKSVAGLIQGLTWKFMVPEKKAALERDMAASPVF